MYVRASDDDFLSLSMPTRLFATSDWLAGLLTTIMDSALLLRFGLCRAGFEERHRAGTAPASAINMRLASRDARLCRAPADVSCASGVPSLSKVTSGAIPPDAAMSS